MIQSREKDHVREKHHSIELSDAAIIAKKEPPKVFKKYPELPLEIPKEKNEKKPRKSIKGKPKKNNPSLHQVPMASL